MKRTAFLLALVAALVTNAPVPLAAQTIDVTGTWVLSVQLDAGTGDATFVLSQEEGEISGTYEGVLGEQQVSGTIEGTEFEWTFNSEAGRIRFSGTVDGDAMTGSCSYGQLGEGSFEGERRPGA